MATYYMRADGTATGKAGATSPSDASTSMNIWIHNIQTFAAGDIIKISDAGGVYYVTSPRLARVSGDAKIYIAPSFKYVIGTTTYTATTSQLAVNPAAGNLPTTKYGAWSFEVNSAGAGSSVAATDNTTGYASAALAIAGLPAVAGDKCRLGYITVYNTSGADFIPGTTTLNAAGISTTVVTAPEVMSFYPPSSGSDGNPITYQPDTGSTPVFSGGIKLNNANWTATGTNGEYRNAVANSATLGIAMAVRGQDTGISTYKRLQEGAVNSLAEDASACNAISGVRYVTYKPLAGHTPDEYDWEYCANNALYTTQNYLTFENLKFICGYNSFYSATVYVSGSNNIFNYCTFMFSSGWGAGIAGTAGQYNNCTASWCRGTGLYFSGTGATYGQATNCQVNYIGTILADITMDRGGIGIQGDNATITGCTIHDIAWAAGMADFTYQNSAIQSTAGHLTATKNYIYTIAQCGIAAAGDATGHHCNINYNIIKNWGLNGAGGTLNNLGIKLYGVGDTADSGVHNVYNNALYHDTDILIIGINLGMATVSDYFHDTNVINNIVRLTNNTNAGSRCIRINRANMTNCVVNYNNFSGPTTPYENAGSTYNDLAAWIAGTTWGDNDISSDPLFANAGGSYALATDFKLKPQSPCINNGVSVSLTRDYFDKVVPQGGAVDIGAAEYQGGVGFW